MKIGLQIPRFHWPGSPERLGRQLADIARTADQAGFASLWVMDHFYQIGGIGAPTDPMLEAYTTLGFLARVTERARLGTMVTGVTYRTPGLLIKAVTTLDVLSGGRAYLGIGAGWNEQEARGLGLFFPPTWTERFERLEETLQIAHQVWQGDFSPYDGNHYHLTEPLVLPQPLSKPHPPILIGGLGEQKTLRMVAQYADACNLFARIGPEQIQHKLNVLRQHCDRLGRDYNTIEKTALVNWHEGQSSAEMVAFLRSLADLGIQHAIFSNLPDVETLRPLELIGRDIVPAVMDL